MAPATYCCALFIQYMFCINQFHEGDSRSRGSAVGCNYQVEQWILHLLHGKYKILCTSPDCPRLITVKYLGVKNCSFHFMLYVRSKYITILKHIVYCINNDVYYCRIRHNRPTITHCLGCGVTRSRSVFVSTIQKQTGLTTCQLYKQLKPFTSNAIT